MPQSSPSPIPPIVDNVLRELRRDGDGRLILPSAGADRLRAELAQVEKGVEFGTTLLSLVQLAYVLDKKHGAPEAARGILKVTEEVARSRVKVPPSVADEVRRKIR